MIVQMVLHPRRMNSNLTLVRVTMTKRKKMTMMMTILALWSQRLEVHRKSRKLKRRRRFLSFCSFSHSNIPVMFVNSLVSL